MYLILILILCCTRSRKPCPETTSNVMLMDCVLFHVLPGLPVASDSAGRKWRRRRCLPLLTIAARHGLLQSWLLTPDTPTPGVIEEHGASLE